MPWVTEKKIDDEDFNAFLVEDQYPTLKELAEALNATEMAFTKLLKSVGITAIHESSVSYQLNPKHFKRRVFTREFLHHSQKIKCFVASYHYY